MKVESTGTVLSTVFVDYDNIYLSLKRKNEEAAKRFAKDAGLWLREIESGRLITPTNGSNFTVPRRIVMSRCYGNPVPRRNASDNSTDMNSFPFVRHHFLRAGFEVVDCPPLTAQLKNSADIRMVMDVRDVLNHDTRFDEFILLSGDADFTPVLHRLRAHARRTVVFANDHTAQPYTAISDGEVREQDLISLLLEGRIDTEARSGGQLREPTSADLEVVRKAIVAEVVGAVRAAAQPVPLEALADRAVRVLGHERTVGSAWGGAGGFRDLLARALPKDIKLTAEAPYFVYEPTRQIARDIETRAEPRPEPRLEAPAPRERRPEPRSEVEARPEPRLEPRYEPRFESPPPAPAYGRDARLEPPAEAMRPQQEDPRRAERAPPRYDDPRYARDEPSPPARGAVPAPSFGQSGLFAPPPDRSQLGIPVPRGHDAPAGAYGAHHQTPSTEPPAHQQRPAAPPSRSADQASQIQQSIARIHEASQAPPLSPPENRVL
ncbi:MAG: NYN domain-containing protein, partial [Hyphomicrobium sp.]|uniref:NYN domain-containing protein n=1 Tax=Hyphomicrobium sp. TaxID=82 RepID=UPI003D0B0A4F